MKIVSWKKAFYVIEKLFEWNQNFAFKYTVGKNWSIFIEIPIFHEIFYNVLLLFIKKDIFFVEKKSEKEGGNFFRPFPIYSGVKANQRLGKKSFSKINTWLWGNTAKCRLKSSFYLHPINTGIKDKIFK